MRHHNITNILKKIILRAINFLLPCRCALCGVFIENPTLFKNLKQVRLCSHCWGSICFIREPFCHICACPIEYDGKGCISCVKNQFSFSSAIAAVVYDDATKILMLQFKHFGKTEYASLFAQWIAPNINTQDIDMIIPMPLHAKRLFKRGYNQSSYLAKELLKILPDEKKIDLEINAIQRIRHTPSQGNKSHNERLINIKDAFRANSDVVKNKRILLIDDVMTTGASLNECSHTLLKAGAIRVDVVVVAKAIKC